MGVGDGVGVVEEDGSSAHEDGKWVRYLDVPGPEFVGGSGTVGGVDKRHEDGDGDVDGNNGSFRPALVFGMGVMGRELLSSSLPSSSIHSDGKEAL